MLLLHYISAPLGNWISLDSKVLCSELGHSWSLSQQMTLSIALQRSFGDFLISPGLWSVEANLVFSRHFGDFGFCCRHSSALQEWVILMAGHHQEVVVVPKP